MAERSQYFDTVSYASADFARHYKTIAGNGYVLSKDDELRVTETSPTSLAVNVHTGAGWIEGRYFEVYSSKERLELDDPSASDRIDRVVVRLDLNNRLVELDTINGTPATSPSPPSLTRTASIYEISLAQVYLASGATAIASSDITDERNDATVCGISKHSSAGTAQALSSSDIQTYLALSKTAGSSAGAETTIEWDTAIYDNENIFTAPNTEIVIPSNGIWAISLNIEITSASVIGDPQTSFDLQLEELINGATENLWSQRLYADSILRRSKDSFMITPIRYLQENDILEFTTDVSGTTYDSFDFEAYVEVYRLLSTRL